MKTLKSVGIMAGLAVAVLFGAAATFQIPTQAIGTFITVTNQPATVATTVNTSINSWVPLQNGSGLGLSWKFNQSGASTSQASIVIYSSVDGTNVSTIPFATLTAASAGTANVIINTNWSPQQLSGLQSLIIGSLTNGASTTLTNKAIVVRRPN